MDRSSTGITSPVYTTFDCFEGRGVRAQRQLFSLKRTTGEVWYPSPLSLLRSPWFDLVTFAVQRLLGTPQRDTGGVYVVRAGRNRPRARCRKTRAFTAVQQAGAKRGTAVVQSDPISSLSDHIRILLLGLGPGRVSLLPTALPTITGKYIAVAQTNSHWLSVCYTHYIPNPPTASLNGPHAYFFFIEVRMNTQPDQS